MAEGDGPVNALDAALRKALNGSFPVPARDAAGRLQGPRDQLRGGAPPPASAWSSRAATSDDVWGTVGVSENIIEASWIALVDSYEYKLCKEEEREALGRGEAGKNAVT